jgi:hypothetical protein
LRARLSADRNYTFTALGTCGYFLSDEPMASSAVSAVTADGTAPDRFLPEGPAAAAHDRLQSELQMCLFEAGTNLAREQSGRVPVNALWFWGGGRTPAPTPGLPPLFGNDPLFRGCWLNGNAAQAPWPGRLGDCATKVADSFVAVVPASSGEDDAFRHIRDARQLLRQGIGRVTLLFRDGRAVRLRRGDSLRFWRRRPSSFTAKADP